MSILIRGMKMPKNCEACDLCYGDVCFIAEAHDFKLDDFCSYGERREDGKADH